MSIVPKANVIKQMEELISTLDLLETNLSLRVTHVLKHKEDTIVDRMEIMDAHLTHMETRMRKHKEEGHWLQNVVHMLAIT